MVKHYEFFILKTPNKRELQQNAINHLSDVDFKIYIKIDKKCTAKSYSFLGKTTWNKCVINYDYWWLD